MSACACSGFGPPLTIATVRDDQRAAPAVLLVRNDDFTGAPRLTAPGIVAVGQTASPHATDQVAQVALPSTIRTPAALSRL